MAMFAFPVVSKGLGASNEVILISKINELVPSFNTAADAACGDAAFNVSELHPTGHNMV